MRLPRPSAPLAVSFLALFVALGGVELGRHPSAAAQRGQRPAPELLGGQRQAQVRTRSAPRKIIPGSVGATQVDPTQVQLRVAGPCTIGAMQSLGSVRET